MHWVENAKAWSFHSWSLSEKAKMAAYQQAIAETVRAGDVVLDLGSGTGILAFLACQAGARRVYAVEVGEAVELAKQVCRQNGLQDRVVFLRELSTRVDLPERVDVLVTETLGNFGLDDGVLGWVLDARARLLKPEGAIVPQSVELFIAPVEAPAAYRRIETWTSDLCGLDFSPLRPFAANNLHAMRLEPEALLAGPVSLGRLRLADVNTPALRSDVSVVAKRQGTLHGLGGWFSAELSKDIFLSNAPPLPPGSRNHAFLPLAHPVPIEEGDRVRMTISTYNGAEWRWQVQVHSPPASPGALPERKAQFDHTTFWGFPLSQERLRKRVSSYAPTLSRRGEAEVCLLAMCNGERTLGEIEQELLARYPDVFRSAPEAAAFVREVVARCG